MTQAKINFQHPLAAATPDGYLLDRGRPLDIRGDQHAYGWLDDNLASMWLPKDREKHQKPVRGSGIWLYPDTRWECAVENGTYTVTVLVGHPESATVRKDTGTFFVGSGEMQLPEDLSVGKFATITTEIDVFDGIIKLHKPKTERSTGINIAAIEFSKL